MASLLGLPVEILHLILADCDKSALLSLCLVARPFPRLVQPFVYADINWEWRENLDPDNNNPRIGLIVRTLLDRPELGELVKCAQLDIHQCFEHYLPLHLENGHSHELESVRLKPKYIDLAMDLMQNMGFSKGIFVSLRDKLHNGHLDALMALFLSQVPSLESLCLGTFLLESYDLVVEVLGLGVPCPDMSLPERPLHFHRLSYVRFGMDKVIADRSITLAHLAPVFYFPAIQELVVTLHNLGVNLDDPDLRPPKEIRSCLTQTLETLRLWYCRIGPSYVAHLLKYTPALKDLQCRFIRDYSPSNHPGRLRFDFTGLTSSLSLAADTLEYLTIGCTWYVIGCKGEEVSATGAEIVPMEPLSAFGKLSCVELHIELLLGSRPWHGKRLSDTLPPNLKALTLVDPSVTWGSISLQDNIDVIAEYLSPRSHNSPFLERVTLAHTEIPLVRNDSRELLRGDSHADAAQLQQLRAMAVSGKVTLTFIYHIVTVGRMFRMCTVVFDTDEPGVEPFESCFDEIIDLYEDSESDG